MVIKEYSVSTAKNGPGERLDSECTPRGRHTIAGKIGAGCKVNTVFVGREATGEIYTPEMRRQKPGRDWILTRILWLQGTEPGFNQGGDVDSYSRFIYIHGAPEDVEIGQPGSRGCIRMRNGDVMELFDKVECGDVVMINE
ncbi:MAG: L,D-transpeptidase family protein [Gammaproteobacteria bacterium]